jgi:hypothetical protein
LLDNFLIYVLALGFSSLMMYLYSTGGLGWKTKYFYH